MTQNLFFRHALLPEGWAQDVRLTVTDGRIAAVACDVPAVETDEIHRFGLPGMPNVHSHTFQRAIAGLTERRSPGEDNFWSWRETMYRFCLKMNPDDVEVVATQSCIEMLESGFTSFAEFHYLHHDPAGRPYDNIAEMATRIAAAAANTGIRLLLLPVFYAHANFGALAPVPAQRRFITNLDGFAKLQQSCSQVARCGIAPHSLRAVTPQELGVLTELAPGTPFHMHIAEQTQEVADCLAWSGQTPVAWLLNHAAVDQCWCLIHATHTDADERARVRARGAVIGLCPITEANLGDGIFDASDPALHLGVGTDSNVLIDVAQELRQLEYTQRLLRRQRNVLASPASAGTATAIYQRAVTGGARALGHDAAGLQNGAAADIITLMAPPAFAPDQALAAAVFAAGRPMIDTVWASGRKCVMEGRHPLAEATRRRFDAVVASLL